MRQLLAITSTAVLLLLVGAGCLVYSMQFSVYTDPDAPWRLSGELESLPPETRSKAWYSQLQAYETPHKRLSDLGRGLLSAGIGLLAAQGFWVAYHRFSLIRHLGVVLLLWLGLWMARIPFIVLFHSQRAERFDYPPWADSIAIPIVVESMGCMVGAVLSGILLWLLSIRHPLPAVIQRHKPVSSYGWVRAVFIGTWLSLLGFCILVGIPTGDEGLVLTSFVAGVILLAFLLAPEVAAADVSTNEVDVSAE